jgi:hypothetical protein
MPRYFLNLFSPDTWATFRALATPVSAHKPRYRKTATTIQAGDIFLCYVTGVSRFCGALEALGPMYEDASPIYGDPDPFSLRWKVRTLAALPPEAGIPVRADAVWNHVLGLSAYDQASSSWTGKFRTSLSEVPAGDGNYLLDLLRRQQEAPSNYPLGEKERAALTSARSVLSGTGEAVPVSVPEDTPEEALPAATPSGESERGASGLEIQARVALIGATMDLDVWVPANDRARVSERLPPNAQAKLLHRLPINFDDTTLQTVSNIDVIWLRRGTMLRAFEVEHTTSIYSGLLRIADLLALQPNIRIRSHIVAPAERLEKWRREVKRPVFALLSGGPLAQSCTFLDYESIDEIAALPTLRRTSPDVIEDYEEGADDP